MASDPDRKGATVTDEDISQEKQTLEDVESKIATLSGRMDLCTKIVEDLNDLHGILVRKSLQDVSLPIQK